MRLNNYLNEGNYELEEFNELIKKDCKYYLDLVDNCIFTRGMHPGRILGKKTVRQDRTPKGMEDDIFKKFNKWLVDNGHLKRDNVVIASSLNKPVTMFGRNHYIFPIGKFNYTFVKTEDINISSSKSGWHQDTVEEYFENPKTFDKLPVPFHTYFVTNKHIKKAYQHQFEIWFDCKEYYFANWAEYAWSSLKSEQKLIRRPINV